MASFAAALIGGADCPLVVSLVHVSLDAIAKGRQGALLPNEWLLSYVSAQHISMSVLSELI